MNGTSSLAFFQDGFTRMLTGEEVDPQFSGLVMQPGFSVYRNTVMKGCVDALLANFPAVLELVGEPWLREAALAYVRKQPPADARLLFYGRQFPDFLADFPPAADMPYLAGVARLDRFWIECHAARDDSAQEPASLLALAPEALGATVLRPLASVRWKWFEGLPVYTIWRSSRSGGVCSGDVEWKGEGAMLFRREGDVRWMEVGAAHCAFLDACASGLPLGAAAASALEADADTDIAQLLAVLLDAGVLAANTDNQV